MSARIANLFATRLDIDHEIADTRWWQFMKRRTLKDLRRAVSKKIDQEWAIWAEMS